MKIKQLNWRIVDQKSYKIGDIVADGIYGAVYHIEKNNHEYKLYWVFARSNDDYFWVIDLLNTDTDINNLYKIAQNHFESAVKEYLEEY